VILQDTDQVPNLALGDFFATSEEEIRQVHQPLRIGRRLAARDAWAPTVSMSHEARHAYMNHNYSEFTHKLARVQFTKPLMRFVASEEEKRWAKQERAKFGADKLVMWVLRGSAVHKVWSGGEDKQNGVAGSTA
jgi:hypothetical protein